MKKIELNAGKSEYVTLQRQINFLYAVEVKMR